jgi:hypothetical protein
MTGSLLLLWHCGSWQVGWLAARQTLIESSERPAVFARGEAMGVVALAPGSTVNAGGTTA